MNKHKEFIKKAYNGELGLTICSEWKEVIEKQYPDFKNQLEVCKWYKGIGKTLVFITNIDNGNIYGYGFDKDGEYWEDDSDNWLDVYNDLAKKEKVEKALINEAKKRGLWGDVKINDHADSGDFSWDISINKNMFTPCYNAQKDKLYNENGVIYYKGKWASIIETITKEEAEKQLGKKIV